MPEFQENNQVIAVHPGKLLSEHSFLGSKWNENNTISSLEIAKYSQGKEKRTFLWLQHKQEPLCRQNFPLLDKISCVHAVSLNTSESYWRTSEGDR